MIKNKKLVMKRSNVINVNVNEHVRGERPNIQEILRRYANDTYYENVHRDELDRTNEDRTESKLSPFMMDEDVLEINDHWVSRRGPEPKRQVAIPPVQNNYSLFADLGNPKNEQKPAVTSGQFLSFPVNGNANANPVPSEPIVWKINHVELPKAEGMEESYFFTNKEIKKVAVLVGINYYGSDFELKGCVSDVALMGKYLMEQGFNKFYLLVERSSDLPKELLDAAVTVMPPTKANIISSFYYACAECNAAVTSGYQPFLYFHYSGHGSNQVDTDGTEEDGYDETLVPLDYNRSGMIVDDMVNNLLCKKLPPSCLAMIVFDACHSGSCCDLPYRWDPVEEKLCKENKDTDYLAKIIFVSGSKDPETSADATIDNKPQGALTASLVMALQKLSLRTNITVGEFGDNLKLFMLSRGFTQHPQISSSFPLGAQSLFFLTNPKVIPTTAAAIPPVIKYNLLPDADILHQKSLHPKTSKSKSIKTKEITPIPAIQQKNPENSFVVFLPLCINVKPLPVILPQSHILDE